MVGLKRAKRGLCAALPFVCACVLALAGVAVWPAAARAEVPRVYDMCIVFTEEEEDALEQRIAAIRDKYDVDVVVLVDEEMEETEDDEAAVQQARAHAERFYDSDPEFGVGMDYSGVMLYYDSVNAVVQAYPYGTAEYYMTEQRQAYMQGYMRSEFELGSFYLGFDRALADIESYLDGGPGADYATPRPTEEYDPNRGREAQRVFDYAQLFTQDEVASLEREIESLRARYGMDFVVLTSEKAQASERDDEAERYSLAYADDFYDYNGFGAGDGASGILVFIDMANRMPTISTCGDMIDYISDARLAAIFDDMHAPLLDAAYGDAVFAALFGVSDYIDAGPEGTRYWTEPAPRRLTLFDVGLAAVLPALVVLGVVFGIRAKYKLAYHAYSYDVYGNSEVNGLDVRDAYLHTTVHKVRRSQDTNSGGGGTGVHTSSSGTTHGGGSGGRF